MLLPRQSARRPGTPDHADEVIQLARWCLESPTVKHALELGTFQREVPFTVPREGGYSLGRVDMAFRDGEALHVVDFKTDEVSAGNAKVHTLEHHGAKPKSTDRRLHPPQDSRFWSHV